MTPQYLRPAPPGPEPDKTFRPFVVAFWLFLFFPVGLVLVWLHPSWAKRTKQYWTAGWAVWAVIIVCYSLSPAAQRSAARQAQQDAQAAALAQRQQQDDAKEQQDDAKAKRVKRAAEEEADARAEAAAQQEQNRQDKITERSLARMRHDFLSGTNGQLVSAVETGDDPYEARVTVKNEWFLRVHQIRLQSAQNLWAEWSQLRSPGDPRRAYLGIVDVNGNHVGGSDVTDGADIKVTD